MSLMLRANPDRLKAGTHTGNKDALCALLVDKFGDLTRSQFLQIKAAVERGAAVAALVAPTQQPQAALALPEPAPAAGAEAPGPSGAAELPLALARPRRGAA